jgi:hypothetical protein
LHHGEDETLLWDMATDMEPEDGRLWIYDNDDQQTVAFTPAGMEYLQGHCHVNRKFADQMNHGRNGSRCDGRLAPR